MQKKVFFYQVEFWVYSKVLSRKRVNFQNRKYLQVNIQL
jgi:hypothetical protein